MLLGFSQGAATSLQLVRTDPDRFRYVVALSGFVFNGGGGQDVVLDFEPGSDLLQIAANINGLEVSTASDLAANVSSVDGNTVIDLGNGDSVTLVGVDASDVQDNPDSYIVVI